jgi:iron(III) transport system substrate-binding protein
MMRQLVSMGVAAAALVFPTVSAQVAAATPEMEKLIAAAKKEGKVEVILSGQVPRKLRAAMPAFEAKYGVKINFQTGSGRKHAERILAERRVGRFTLDVWLGGANTALVQLLPNKALASFPELLVDPEVKDPKLWYRGRHHYTDPEHRFIFTWGASPAYNISYNTKLVKPQEIKSYHDLLSPKWKGKIVSWSPGAQGTAASSVPMFINPKIGEKWFRRWANEMKPVIVTDARQAAEWVAIGRFPIGLFGTSTQAEILAGQGFPIAGWLPHPMAEGEVLSASAANLMAMDRAPNPNARNLFLNWALSKEGQSLFIKVAEKTDSLRRDVDNKTIAPQYRINPEGDYYVPFSDPTYINSQDEIITKLRTIMKEAGYK